MLEKLPVIQYEIIKDSESRYLLLLLLSVKTHTILWSLTIMISKYFISSKTLRGICKIKTIIRSFLTTVPL